MTNSLVSTCRSSSLSARIKPPKGHCMHASQTLSSQSNCKVVGLSNLPKHTACFAFWMRKINSVVRCQNVGQTDEGPDLNFPNTQFAVRMKDDPKGSNHQSSQTHRRFSTWTPQDSSLSESRRVIKDTKTNFPNTQFAVGTHKDLNNPTGEPPKHISQ